MTPAETWIGLAAFFGGVWLLARGWHAMLTGPDDFVSDEELQRLRHHHDDNFEPGDFDDAA